MVVSQWKKLQIIIFQNFCFCAFIFKTTGLYSSGGVVGIAMGAYAGETQFESRPLQEYFSKITAPYYAGDTQFESRLVKI